MTERGEHFDRGSALLGSWSSACFLICALCLFVAPVYGQQADDFRSTVEKIKSGVAPVTCTHATAPSQLNVRVHGTAFFIDPHGTFLTASHVIKSVTEKKDESCETPAVLVRTDRSAFNSLNLYGLKFVASDCRIDESADIAQCKTVADPTEDKEIVAKPAALAIASDLLPDGTPVAFTAVFLDETGLTTKMTRLYGRSRRGERVIGAVPHGHWRTTTFIAGLRQSGIIAPLVLDGPMTGTAFRAYVEQALAPVLQRGGS